MLSASETILLGALSNYRRDQSLPNDTGIQLRTGEGAQRPNPDVSCNAGLGGVTASPRSSIRSGVGAL